MQPKFKIGKKCFINTTFPFFPAETTYKATVTTSDVRGAGTDANVFMVIFGEHGDSGEIALKHSETFKDKFERDHQDVFYLKNLLSLGESIFLHAHYSAWHLTFNPSFQSTPCSSITNHTSKAMLLPLVILYRNPKFCFNRLWTNSYSL